MDTSEVPDYARWSRLDGKGVVVLGAGQGIGRQACHALAQSGARVLCVDSDADAAGRIAREVDGFPCQADITGRAGMESVFARAAAVLEQPYGVVDIVGRALIAPIDAVDDTQYEQQLDLVFRHAWLAVQLGTRWLAGAPDGVLVFVGSLSGETALPQQALYGAQKAALHHLVRCAAVEYGPRGIRVNTVAPGPTHTPRLDAMMGERWGSLERSIPLRRAGQAADIAAAILYLASPMARHVTGQTLVVDGGSVATISRPTTNEAA